MTEWQPIETAPMDQDILVAYHGHGYVHVQVVRRVGRLLGRHGDFDYINSHDGQPQYWLPIPAPPDGLKGPHCNCEGCTEEYHSDEWPDGATPAQSTDRGTGR